MSGGSIHDNTGNGGGVFKTIGTYDLYAVVSGHHFGFSK
jgi:hypothetical protein